MNENLAFQLRSTTLFGSRWVCVFPQGKTNKTSIILLHTQITLIFTQTRNHTHIGYLKWACWCHRPNEIETIKWCLHCYCLHLDCKRILSCDVEIFGIQILICVFYFFLFLTFQEMDQPRVNLINLTESQIIQIGIRLRQATRQHRSVWRRQLGIRPSPTNQPHQIGDIVWAKLDGHSTWPAQITNIENRRATVVWFGTGEPSTVPIGRVFWPNLGRFAFAQETRSQQQRLGLEAAARAASQLLLHNFMLDWFCLPMFE